MNLLKDNIWEFNTGIDDSYWIKDLALQHQLDNSIIHNDEKKIDKLIHNPYRCANQA